MSHAVARTRTQAGFVTYTRAGVEKELEGGNSRSRLSSRLPTIMTQHFMPKPMPVSQPTSWQNTRSSLHY